MFKKNNTPREGNRDAEPVLLEKDNFQLIAGAILDNLGQGCPNMLPNLEVVVGHTMRVSISQGRWFMTGPTPSLARGTHKKAQVPASPGKVQQPRPKLLTVNVHLNIDRSVQGNYHYTRGKATSVLVQKALHVMVKVQFTVAPSI